MPRENRLRLCPLPRGFCCYRDRRAIVLRVLFAAAVLHGCGGDGTRQDRDPGTASEIAPRAAEVEAGPQTSAVDIAEHARIGAEDVGNTLVAHGTVVGRPLQEGFFFATEDNAVIFVRSHARVASGDRLRLVGPMRPFTRAQAEAAIARAFPEGMPPHWNLRSQVVVEATNVNAL